MALQDKVCTEQVKQGLFVSLHEDMLTQIYNIENLAIKLEHKIDKLRDFSEPEEKCSNKATQETAYMDLYTQFSSLRARLENVHSRLNRADVNLESLV